MPSATLSVGDRFFTFPVPDHLAYSPRDSSGTASTFALKSTAKVCPFCLSIWSVFRLGDQTGPFQIARQACSRCLWDEWGAGPPVVPGSLIDYPPAHVVLYGLLDSLPPELVQRELLLTISWYERYSAKWQQILNQPPMSLPSSPAQRSSSKAPPEPERPILSELWSMRESLWDSKSDT